MIKIKSYKKYFGLIGLMLVFAAFFALSATDGFAATTFGSILRVDDNTGPVITGQWNPAIATDTNGDIYAVWQDSRDSGQYNIYFAKSTDGGVSFGTNLRVNDPGFSSQMRWRPAITVDTNGDIYVVWDQSTRGNFYHSDIYFAKSTDGGASFEPAVLVDDAPGKTKQSMPSIATDTDGDIYVVWQDNRIHQAINVTYFAKSTDGGASFRTNVCVNDVGASITGDSWPSVAVDANKDIYVAWQDNRSGYYNTYCAKSTDGGASFGTNVRVDDTGTTTSWQSRVGLVIDTNGDVYVAWQDNRNVDSLDFDIYLAKSTDGGATFGTNTCVNDINSRGQFRPLMAIDPDDNIYLTWEDNRNGSNYSDFNIYFTKSTDGGASFETDVRVDASSSTAIWQDDPAIAVDLNGNTYVIWDDGRNAIYSAKGTDSGTVSLYDNVVINEFVPNSQGSNREWVEFYNKGTVNVDISGCWLDDEIGSGNAPQQIPAGMIIYPLMGDVVNLGTGNNYLRDQGDTLNFLQPDGTTVIDSKTFGSVTGDSGSSIYRFPDGKFWADDMDDTPTPITSNDGPDDISVTITITPNTASLTVADTQQFSASGGTGPYAWTSDTPAIGTINSSNGVFSAVSHGTCTVTATDVNSDSGTSGTITVIAPTITVTPNTASLTVAETLQFSASGGTGYYPWTSDTPGVGTINNSGLFSAVSPGTCTVTATDINGYSGASGTITVTAPTITITPNTGNLIAGDTLQFSASGGTTPYAWTSSVNAVGTINSSGLFSAVGSGTCTVTAVDANTYAGVSGVISVTDPSVTITITPNTGNLIAGDTLQFSASGGTGPYTWESSDTNIGTIDNNGLFSAVSHGTCTVTAVDANSYAGVSGTITVIAPTITITPNTASLTIVDTQQFNASGGTGPYTWTSSNTAIGTINSSGIFSAVGIGTCTVTATDANGYAGVSGTITVRASSSLNVEGLNPPYYQDNFGLNPDPQRLSKATCVPRDSNIILHIAAYGSALIESSVCLSVDGEDIIINGVIQPGEQVFTRSSLSDYIIGYDPTENFKYEQVVSVHVTAEDSSGDSLDYTYSFTTESMILGLNAKVNDNRAGATRDNSSIAVDNSGKNIYVVWEEDSGSDYDIYLAKSADRGLTFGSDIKVNNSPVGTNQRYPVIDITQSGDILLAWQDDQDFNSTGWDICTAMSTDGGASFTEHKYDYSYNQTQPSIAARSNDQAYLAYTASNNLGSAIYFASSTQSQTDAWYTFEAALQVSDSGVLAVDSPSLAIDSSGSDSNAYIAWKDQSGGIFHDNNQSGSFGTDVRVDGGTQALNADSPSIGVGPNGKDIYIAWQATTGSDQDVFFAKSDDWGVSFASSVEVIDDTTNESQKEPALGVDNNGDVFITWHDLRNVSDQGDIYLSGSMNRGSLFDTNLLINGDNGSTTQKNPSLALNASGQHVNICWTDSRSGTSDIYFAKNSVINIRESAMIGWGQGGTVTLDDNTSYLHGAQVEIPAGALEADTTITIGEIDNPPPLAPPQGQYAIGIPIDFGSGGTEFNGSATIRIPYSQADLTNAGITGSNYELSIYYFDSGTNNWIEIANCITYPTYVEGTVTHFSFFDVIGSILSGGGDDDGGGGGIISAVTGGGGGSSGGGGCFIATAAYGTSMAGEVKILSEFRDKYLLADTNSLGKKLVSLYYKFSPPIADHIAEREDLKAKVRTLLKPFIWFSKAVIGK